MTSASRTLLLGLDELAWDDGLLELFGVERTLLPRVVPSSIVGDALLDGAAIPIAAIAGDSRPPSSAKAASLQGRLRL